MNIWRHWNDETNPKWGYTWSVPCPDLGELEWRLRYGEPSRTDLLAAAGVLACYAALIELPEHMRRKIISELRKGPSPRASLLPPAALQQPKIQEGGHGRD